jgi:hypothetical protein
VDEVEIVNKNTGAKGKVHFLMDTKLLVGIYPKFLQDHVANQLIQNPTQQYNLAGTQLVWQVPPV